MLMTLANWFIITASDTCFNNTEAVHKTPLRTQWQCSSLNQQRTFAEFTYLSVS